MTKQRVSKVKFFKCDHVSASYKENPSNGEIWCKIKWWPPAERTHSHEDYPKADWITLKLGGNKSYALQRLRSILNDNPIYPITYDTHGRKKYGLSIKVRELYKDSSTIYTLEEAEHIIAEAKKSIAKLIKHLDYWIDRRAQETA